MTCSAMDTNSVCLIDISIDCVHYLDNTISNEVKCSDEVNCEVSESSGDQCGVSICGQIRRGRPISQNADKWFSEFLSEGRSDVVTVRLVRCVQSTDNNTSQVMFMFQLNCYSHVYQYLIVK